LEISDSKCKADSKRQKSILQLPSNPLLLALEYDKHIKLVTNQKGVVEFALERYVSSCLDSEKNNLL
jgi:hypothetical protein